MLNFAYACKIRRPEVKHICNVWINLSDSSICALRNNGGLSVLILTLIIRINNDNCCFLNISS